MLMNNLEEIKENIQKFKCLYIITVNVNSKKEYEKKLKNNIAMLKEFVL